MSNTPLCERLAGADYWTTVIMVREMQEQALADRGREMLTRLNDIKTFNTVLLQAEEVSGSMGELCAHIRAYLLSGRMPQG